MPLLLRRSAWKITILIGLVAVAGYLLLPPAGRDIDYAVASVGTVAAVMAAIRYSRPRHELGWFALAVGLLCWVAGDIVHGLYKIASTGTALYPSAADALYLVGYPFLIVGVVGLTAARGIGASRESYADAAIVAVGALALSWHFLMNSYVHTATMGLFAKSVALAYPVLDLGLLFILVQGAFSGVARRAALRLLAVAMVLVILADFFRAWLTLRGGYVIGGPLDAAWLASYVLIAAAALHPAMAVHPALGSRRPGDSGQRLPVVALAALVPPIILLIGAAFGTNLDVAPLAVISILLFALVVGRIRWMLARIGAQTQSLKQSLEIRDSLEIELRHQAFHDTLTGLPNRALLYDRVGLALAGTPRRRGVVAVCFCDLDGFKTINDSLGHLAGDDVLVATGKRLSAVVRPGDTVARLGGDEFAVLMTDLEDPVAAITIAERIVAVMHQPVVTSGRSISVSVSVGVAVAGHAASTEVLLSEADSAMYEAKYLGRDRFALFDESMHARIAERLELTNGFEGALDRGEFFVQYQPQYSLVNGDLEGFEALIRWHHPRLGLLTPQRFVPLAEETGHIVAIGRWVLATACEQAGEWSRQSGIPLAVAVNLSSRQLQERGLIDDVRTAIALGALAPQQLVLELTESILIADSEFILRVLTDLKSIGVRLAIDDFGTGYSSLSYLRRLPVDILKIDKSFVDPLSDPTGEGSAFVTMIVTLARTLGLQTIAEGIEHTAQQELLASLGCDSAQGYLFSRPLGRDAASRLVRAHQKLSRDPVPKARMS